MIREGEEQELTIKFLPIMTLLFTVLLASQCIIPAFAVTPTLTLNLDVTKKIYNVGENVETNGTLFYDWNSSLPRIPVRDVVTVQVNYPAAHGIYMLRTMATGSLEFKTWHVEILQVTPCDESGNPRTNFLRGTYAYFAVTWRNNDQDYRYVMITFTACYGNGLPFLVYSPTSGMLSPNETRPALLQVPIDSGAPTGPAKIYVNALSGWVNSSGYPYCPETPADFNIVAAQGFGASSERRTADLPQTQVDTAYNLTFPTVTTGGYIGNYTVYASSRLVDPQQATNTTIFQEILLGDVNGNLAVTVQDYQLVKNAIPSTPGSPKWNPNCDLNNDHVVDVKDYAIVKKNIGHYAYP